MVEAVDVRTTGLGGDSEVDFDRDTRLRVGPRKAMPLSLLAHQVPDILGDLRALAVQDRLPDFPTQYAFRNPGRTPPEHLDGVERRAWDALATEPRRVSNVVRNLPGLAALRRLADARLVTIAAFTPSDAMHLLGKQHGWCAEAAELGARILATQERNGRSLDRAAAPVEIAERTAEHVIRESARIILATALAHDPGVEAKAGRFGILGDRLIEDTIAGRRFSGLIDGRLALATPVIAIGAPVGAYYPEVARRLGAPLAIPEHAAVCNAVGAVAGVVSQSIEILVNQPTFKVFRVHDPAGSQDYGDVDEALAHARRVATELALAAAVRAGAADPHVETTVSERRAHMGASDYLAEAVVRATATGRPLAGDARAPGN
jgi:N-methylhydantoinase A/oxoprolinase/acetone carboxylase beta subunit